MKHQRALLLPIALLLAFAAARPTAAAPPDRSGPPKLGPPPSFRHAPIQQFTLSNGLSVYLLEKREVPIAEVVLLIRSGQVSDPAGKSGLATLAAEMLTDGAGGRDALQLADEIDFLGATIQAFAGSHTSRASLWTPVSKLAPAMEIFADVALRPAFPADELDRRRAERLTTMLQWRDEPEDLARIAMNRELFGETHPYGSPSIGTEQTLRSIAVEDLRAFHDRHYRPNNAVVVAVGDLTVDSVRPLLEEAFGGWKAGEIPPAELGEAPQVSDRSITLIDKPGAAQTVILVGRIGARRTDPDYDALELMNTILGGSFTCRLNRNLREAHGWTYGARSRFEYRELPGPFVAGASVQTSVTDSALTEILGELGAIREPVPAEELERAKRYLALGFPGEFASIEQIAGMISTLVVYGLPLDTYNTAIGRVLALDAGKVQATARKFVDPERVRIVLVGDRAQIESRVAALSLGPIRTMSVEDLLGPPPIVEGSE